MLFSANRVALFKNRSITWWRPRDANPFMKPEQPDADLAPNVDAA
jgi:hypothetical protein